LSPDEKEVQKRIIQIVRENNSNPDGITKTELARVFTQRWGNTKTTIWLLMIDLIDSGKIELRRIKKQQEALFLPK